MDSTLRACIQHKWCCRGLFVMDADGSIIDICNVIDAAPYSGFVNLCPRLYPPNEDGFQSVYSALKDQVKKMGFDLTIGRTRNKGTEKHILCQRARKFFIKTGSEHKRLIEQSKDGVTFSYKAGIKQPFMRGFNHNDIRKHGKSLPRCTHTASPINAEDVCPFNFLLKCSQSHWYLRRGMGNYSHSGHPRRIHESNASTLTDADKSVITDMKSSLNGTMAIRQLFFFKHSKTLSTQQILWINKCFQNESESTSTTERSNSSASDRLISYMQKDKTISFILLYDDSGSKLIGGRTKGRPRKNEDFILTAKTYLNNGSSVPDQSITIPAKDNLVLSKFSTPKQKKVFIGVAWVTDNERRLFNAFPEVSFVDTTSQTNNELRPLLMMCGKDSNSQPFVALRFIMPSEQRWTFKWFYEIAAPILLGRKACSRNSLGITDGDPNEYMSFTSSMGVHYPNSMHLLCRWHLVTHNTNKQHFGSRGHPIGGPIFAKELKSWLNSLCLTPETKLEYTYSVNKLMEWLGSASVKLSTLRHDEAKSFVLSKILPHEEKYAYYKWMYVRAFNETTNSAGESLNSGSKQTKSNPVGVRPNMDVCKTATNLNMMSSLKLHTKFMKHEKNVISEPLWSFTSLGGKITNYALGILRMQSQSSKEYLCLQVSDSIWKVKKESNSHVRPVHPTFIRTRSVCAKNCGTRGSFLICDCGLWQRFGIPCRHIIHVCHGNIDIDDLALRWRKDYILYYMQVGYEEYTKRCDNFISYPPMGPIFRPEHCQHDSNHSTPNRDWFFEEVRIIDGISQLDTLFKSSISQPASRNHEEKDFSGLSQDINLNQNVSTISQQESISQLLPPPGGSYHVLAPIFQSLSSMAELDTEALQIALNGLSRTHEDVSTYIKEKQHIENLNADMNSNSDFISSNYATSRGTISKLSKLHKR